MRIGVHQHIRRSVSCGSLNGPHIAAKDHQLIGGTGMAQTVKDDATMRGNSGWVSYHLRNFLRISTDSTARPLGKRNNIPLSW